MVLSFEDSPIFDWYKKNRVFILFLIVVVFGGNAYLYFAPSMTKGKNAEEWTRFTTRSAEINLEENFAAQIAAAREDQNTFQWFLYSATRAALQSNNQTALSILKNELLSLEGSSDKWKGIDGDGQAYPIKTLLIEAINGQTNLPKFTNPEPKGNSYLISVSSDKKETYEIYFTLYSEDGQTAMWLEDGIGGLEGQEIENFNNRSITIKGLAPPAGELKVERENRLFHESGVLTTLPTGESDGSQKQDVLQILLEDNYMADGISTVIGKITGGLEELKVALAEQEGGSPLKIESIEAL